MGITSQGRSPTRSAARPPRHNVAGIATFLLLASGFGAWGLAQEDVEYGASVALRDEIVPGEEIVPDDEVVPATRGALVELGRRLFFDPSGSSRMGMRSCADCHDPAHGYSDAARTSLDDTAPTGRHSQTLVDDGEDTTAHWDGAFSSIDGFVSARLAVTFTRAGDGYYRPERGGTAGTAVIVASDAHATSVPVIDDTGDAAAPQPAEVEFLPPPAADAGLAARDARPDALAPTFVNRETASRSDENASRRVRDHGRYAEAFRAAYGSEAVSVARIAQAVAEYCRSIRSGASGFDHYAAGDRSALEPAAVRGLSLFRGRAGCVSCHTMDGYRAPFTDHAFHDTGVAWRSRLAGADPTDDGRHAQTGRIPDFRRFKTPTLRDVARRGPYMHDGSLATLEDVVRYYASDAPMDPNLDARFPRFVAAGTDVADLAAFLRALTSDRRPGLASTTWNARAARTRLEFVDGYGDPLPRLKVVLVPAGDVLPGFTARDGEPRSFETDASGAIEFAPRHSTHTRVVLERGLPLVGGDLVVDTCRRARLIVGVAGRTAISVLVPEGIEPPDTLEARHAGAMTYPDRLLPVTVLRRASVVDDGTGQRLARYEGPRRLDAESGVELLWPSPSGPPRTVRGTLIDQATPALEPNPSDR